MKNYYQILGLETSATAEEIKKAYRLYASKFHPDKQNGDKFFEERFREIKEAYDILSDVNKRKAYDFNFESTFHASNKRNQRYYSNTNARHYSESTTNSSASESNTKQNYSNANTHSSAETSRPETSTDSFTKTNKSEAKKEPVKEDTIKIYYQNSLICITSKYIETKISKEKYLLKDLKGVVCEKKFQGSSIFIGFILIGIGFALLFNEYWFVFGIIVFVVGICVCFAKGRQVVLIDKTDKKIQLPTIWAECEEVTRIIQRAMLN